MANKLILYLEDQAYDVELTKTAFYEVKGREWRMISFVLGNKALDYLFGRPPYEDRKTHPLPDLILLDLNLPDINGLEVLHEIKADASLQTIPVAIFTTSDKEEDQTTALAEGAAAYYRKPGTYSELVEFAEKFLNLV